MVAKQNEPHLNDGTLFIHKQRAFGEYNFNTMISVDDDVVERYTKLNNCK